MSVGTIASQGFSPNKLAGLKLWLDASDRGYIIDSGGDVSQWTDKSKDGSDAIQTTGSNQPKTGIETINGLNAIDFEGVNQYFNANGLAGIPLSDHTIIFMVHLDAPDELQCIFGWNYNAGANNAELLCFSAIGDFESRGNIGNNNPPNPLIEGGLIDTDIIIAVTLDRSALDIVTRLNGVQETLLPINLVTTSETCLIGAEFDTGSIPGNFMDMKAGEMVIYDRILLAAEILEFENYNSNKWITSFPSVFTSDFSLDFS